MLVPIDVSEPASYDSTLLDAIPSSNVVLLGYWPIPDQSSAAQLRDQLGDEADSRLQDVANRLDARGLDIRTRLAFIKDRTRTIDGAANEYDCGSVLFPGTGPVSDPLRVLVLIKPDADLDRLAETVGVLFADTDAEILLFHVVETDHEPLYDATEYMLRGLADRIRELGLDADRLDYEQTTDGERLDVIADRTVGFDVVVSSETEPTVRERIFGSVQSRLVDGTDASVLTVRVGR